jgi:putative membrane protein
MFLTGWLILAIAIGVAAAILPGVDVDGGLLAYLWIAALFAVINILLGPILRLLSAPVIILTLGLFSFVVNALLFVITAWLSDALSVDGFLDALLAALIVSLITTLVGGTIDIARRRAAVR